MGILLTILVIVLAIVGLIGAYLFYVLRKQTKYFKKLGVPYIGGLGHLAKLVTGSMNLVEMEERLYRDLIQSQSPMVGICDLAGESNLLVSDPEILRNILVKDFDHFINRRDLTSNASKYFKKMIFAAQNEQWKGTRAKLSPTFTTGRIRRMFQIFKTSSDRMTEYLRVHMGHPGKKSVDVDFAQIFSKYAMDVIASCAFGIDSKSWELPPDQSSTFERMGRQFGFHFSGKVLLKFIVMTVTPKIADLFEMDVMDWESQSYLDKMVKQVVKQRRETGERRDDFLQLMLDAQQNLLKADEETAQVMNGSIEGSGTSLGANDALSKLVTFDDDVVIANAMLFLLGGFDTTQSLLLFTLYSLALEPDVQEKLYAEVTSVLCKHGGELSYDVISEMTYLDMVINEAMRLYPPATRLERACNKEYPVPGTNLVVEKNIVIIVPVMGIHRDPKNFPNPEKFMPERFSPENKAGRHPYVFLPFGHGPRNCIGMRFALVEVKSVLVHLVNSYRITPCAKTEIPVQFGTNVTIKPKNGMWLNITARE